jgi:hypothetical protein
MNKEYKKTRKLLISALLISIFSLGFISAYLVLLLDNQIETPFSFNANNSPKAPNNYVNEEDIKVYDDRIIIYLDDARISRYAPTGSMLPFIDEYSNGIKITPASEDEIEVGDIITFRSGSDLIVHRVVEKGYDDSGVYFITKGDNNIIADGKIRFSDIESKTIGVLY